MGAGKGWSSQENILACQAFIAASENSAKGNGQKKEKFEQSIEQNFLSLVDILKKNDKAFTPASQRNGSSIAQRFKFIRKACPNFHGVVMSIRNADPTGSPSDEDVFNAATAVYNDLASVSDMYKYFGTSTLKVGKPFTFLNCYKWLKTTFMWKMITSSNVTTKKTTPDGNIESNEPGAVLIDDEKKAAGKENSTSERRPVGAKRAAAQSKQIAVLERGATGIEGLAEESKKRNEIALEMLLLEKRNSRLSLFQLEGTLTDMKRKFLEMEQKRVLKEMESESEIKAFPQKKTRTESQSKDNDDGSVETFTVVDLSKGTEESYEGVQEILPEETKTAPLRHAEISTNSSLTATEVGHKH